MDESDKNFLTKIFKTINIFLLSNTIKYHLDRLRGSPVENRRANIIAVFTATRPFQPKSFAAATMPTF